MQAQEPSVPLSSTLEPPPEGLWRTLEALLSRRREDWGRIREVVATQPLGLLSRWSAGEWRWRAGLTRAEGERLVAAFALGRAVEKQAWPERPVLRRAQDVHAFMLPRMRGLQREVFTVLHLNVQNALQGMNQVSVGTLTSSLVHPREVFASALSERAAAVLVVHNHPSGDPEPSQADRDVTRRLIRAGRLLGIPLVDHVICGDRHWRSMRECMDFESGEGWDAVNS